MPRLLVVFWIGVVGSVASAADPVARHDMSAADYASWLEGLKKKDYSPSVVSVHVVAGKPVFAALAVPAGKAAWVARHDLDSAGYQRLFEEQTREGKRPAAVCGYHDGKESRYAAVFVTGGGPFSAVHEQTGEDFQKASDRASGEGLAPSLVSGFPTPKGARFVVVFAGSGEWTASCAIDATGCRKALDSYRRDGFVPAWASGYDDAGAARFNLVGRRDPGLEWVARHDMTSVEFQKEHGRLGREGYTIRQLSGYPADGRSRYLAVWGRDRPLPVAGREVPELAAFDKAMLSLMKECGIRAGTLAVLRDGRVVLSRGYGYATADGKTPIEPDAPLRLASVVKPMTAAAIRRLIARGKLREDTHAFDLLKVEPPEGSKPDKRLSAITVAHLLEHRGGWDAGKSVIGDPMFQHHRVATALELKEPPTANDVVRYVAGQPLDFDPGSRSVYSNFGYCVLGRVVEKVSGKSYESYLRQEVMAPLKITSIDLGRTLPNVRHPREPFYFDPGVAPNVMTGKGYVPIPDGGFHLESLDSHGGLIGSAPDVARFYAAYDSDGRPNPKGEAGFNGGLWGTATMAYRRADGVVMVALFNQRPDKPTDLRKTLDQVATDVKKWP